MTNGPVSPLGVFATRFEPEREQGDLIPLQPLELQHGVAIEAPSTVLARVLDSLRPGSRLSLNLWGGGRRGDAGWYQSCGTLVRLLFIGQDGEALRARTRFQRAWERDPFGSLIYAGGDEAVIAHLHVPITSRRLAELVCAGARQEAQLHLRAAGFGEVAMCSCAASSLALPVPDIQFLRRRDFLFDPSDLARRAPRTPAGASSPSRCPVCALDSVDATVAGSVGTTVRRTLFERLLGARGR